MAGPPKGYKQADTHRLRIALTRRLAKRDRMDERYTRERRALDELIQQTRDELQRAEVRERIERADKPEAVSA